DPCAHPPGQGVAPVEVDAQDRAGDVEVLAREPGHGIRDAEPEDLDREVRRLLDRDEPAALPDEGAERFDPFLPDPARVLRRERAGRVPLYDRPRRLRLA